MHPKSKIVLVGPCYPYRGGNALFMSHLYEALQGKFEIEFINYKLLYPSLLFPGTTQYDKSDDHYLKVETTRMVNSIGPLSWWKTAQHIKKLNPDLIAIDWWQPFFGPSNRAITSFLRKQFPNKILFITENVISHEARWIDRILTNIGLKHADKFLALSQKVVDDVQLFSGERKIYRSELPVYGWYAANEKVDLTAEKEKLGFKKDDTVLLFFGYVRRYKGLDILMRAFAQLRAKRPDLKLLVAGEFYDKPEYYQEIMTQLNLGNDVKLINQYVPNEELALYFQLSELVVLPYRTGTQSGILNIAYGYHKPVVITDVGGLAEFVEDGKTGVIVPEASPENIATGILKYFQLAANVNFSENVRLRVEQNGFNKIAEVFQEIISES